MQFAGVRPGKQAGTDQRSRVLLPQLGVSQFRQHGEPL